MIFAKGSLTQSLRHQKTREPVTPVPEEPGHSSRESDTPSDGRATLPPSSAAAAAEAEGKESSGRKRPFCSEKKTSAFSKFPTETGTRRGRCRVLSGFRCSVKFCRGRGPLVISLSDDCSQANTLKNRRRTETQTRSWNRNKVRLFRQKFSFNLDKNFLA